MKKLTALLLCLAMICTMFAGCGADASASVADTPASAVEAPAEAPAEVPTEAPAEAPAEVPAEAPAETPAEAPVEAPEEEAPAVTYPLVEETVSFEMWATATPQVIQEIVELNNHQGYAMAEEITGVHMNITTIQTDAAREQLPLLVAGGDYPDIFRGAAFSSGDLDAYESEVIIDLTDYLEEYAPNYYALITENASIGQNVCTDEGYHLSFYRIYQEKGGYDDISVTQGQQIRKDLLDQLNMDIPTTMEELDEVVTAFKNNFGLTDAVLLQNSITNMGDTLISAYGIGFGFYNQDGTVMYGPMQDGFKEYLLQLNEWYNEGILNSDFVSYSTNPNDETVIGKVTTAKGVGTFFSGGNDMATRREQSEEGMMYVGMPALKGPDGKNHFGLDANAVKGSSYHISTQCENVELLVQWNDFWYSEDGIIITNFGKEGENYEMVDGKPQWTDFVTSNPNGLTQGVVRQAYLMYTVHGICTNDNEVGMLDEIAQEAVATWTSSSDRAYLMPTVSYTTEESGERATLLSDIDTYNEEVQLKMVIGELDIETYWETYQNDLKNMGIEKVIAITQDALDRFNAR